jgi:DNA-damage-inducible protein J
MARTSNIFARVEPSVKEQAEEVLEQLGIPMSNAVGMFLRQIVLQRGIPFEMKLPANAPIAFGALTKEQFDTEINKGLSDIKAGRVHSADSVEEEMKRDFGV